MKKIALILLTSMILGCTSENDFKKGKQLLEQQGFFNVKNTGYNYFCCDEKEEYSTGFQCNDRNGNIIKGYFCSSIGKGITIRFE